MIKTVIKAFSSFFNSDELVKSPKSVTPVKTGVQNTLKSLDSHFRGNDRQRESNTFYEGVNSQFSILNSQFGFKGFTFIELIMVIIIVGILAASITYKIGSMKVYSVAAETDILKANLRYAQYRALSDADKRYGQKDTTWGISLSGSSYTLQKTEEGVHTTPNFPGETSSTRYKHNLPSGISITTGAITYDAYGRPTGNLTITVSGTDGTFETIIVTQNTGFIP